VKAWNQWRWSISNISIKADLCDANLSKADLSEGNLSDADLSGANLSNTNLGRANLRRAKLRGADLSRAYLRRADLSNANLSGANLHGANLWEANLWEGNLSDADLSGAYLRRADLYKANLGRANLHGANLSDANLVGADLGYGRLIAASLVGTNLEDADLTGCRVYGISVWNAKLDGAIQSDLLITPPGEPAVSVDDLEVAQFIYLLLNNAKIRHIIDTIGKRAVLILGRFTPGRKAVLDCIREALRHLGSCLSCSISTRLVHGTRMRRLSLSLACPDSSSLILLTPKAFRRNSCQSFQPSPRYLCNHCCKRGMSLGECMTTSNVILGSCRHLNMRAKRRC